MKELSYFAWVNFCLEEPRVQVMINPSLIFQPKHYALIIGLFIVLPCIESYKKVDLRTITLGVPPQEVSI